LASAQVGVELNIFVSLTEMTDDFEIAKAERWGSMTTHRLDNGCCTRHNPSQRHTDYNPTSEILDVTPRTDTIYPMELATNVGACQSKNVNAGE
jgi:hypothetical protein